MRLLFVVTEDWYFASHRLALAVEARRAGYDVAVATRFDRHRGAIEASGVRTVCFGMDRRGLNPLTLFGESIRLCGIIRRERPDLVHLVALRPVVVGGLAVRLAGVRHVVSAVAGMGFLFTDDGRLPWVRRTVQGVLPFLLGRGLTIVQNSDDARLLESFGLAADRVRLIPGGAGVDLGRFTPARSRNAIPVVMMAARLLRDKGVEEFVEAARRLRGGAARFVLVGAIDDNNPAAIPKPDLQRWIFEGTVEWWGHSDNMAGTLAKADIFCLPSYREGLPKGLLEAMAVGLACVTTDIPGCRDAVRDGDNGLLVPARDVTALVAAISRLIDDTALRQRLAERGRTRAEQEFCQDRVFAATLAIYREVLS